MQGKTSWFPELTPDNETASGAATQIHAGRFGIFQVVEMDVKTCVKSVKKGLKTKYRCPLPALSYRVPSRGKCPKMNV